MLSSVAACFESTLTHRATAEKDYQARAEWAYRAIAVCGALGAAVGGGPEVSSDAGAVGILRVHGPDRLVMCKA
jgi:hypothetical protein